MKNCGVTTILVSLETNISNDIEYDFKILLSICAKDLNFSIWNSKVKMSKIRTTPFLYYTNQLIYFVGYINQH